MTKTYLAAYNFIAFVFWGAYFGAYLYSGLQLTDMNLVLLNIAQGWAILEVFHALFKWVKTPVRTTIAQVASRLLVVALLDMYSGIFFPSLFSGAVESLWLCKAGIIIISFAWSITELVRYSLYFLSLFQLQPRPLLWMRYSFFIVLYPCGVIGEWLILVAPLGAPGAKILPYAAVLAVLLISYLIGFPALYIYMWKQRKSKLN